MKMILNSMALRTLVLLFAASVTFGQAFAQGRVPFRQAELDQMLAPLALYPDSLLSQILMASTYPLEVAQASRWSRANPGLKGQEAVRAVERMDWDPSVKSLAAFPEVLAMMDAKVEWTERLGEAFLAQQADVMDTVQGLRRRAEAAGNLRSDEQMRVSRQGEVITINSPAPEIVYVPYYNPAVVYGAWWWPTFPPVFWAPPAYYVVHAHRPAFWWGPGIVISAGFFFGHFDWPHRHVQVVHRHPNHAYPVAVHSAWRHDAVHRRGVPFRNAEARQRFEQDRAGARRDADRVGAAQTARRVDDNRSVDIRQRRMEERRETLRRRESAVDRATANDDGNRRASNRIDDRVTNAVPGARAAQLETRRTQPETRGIQRETRNAPQDRNTRIERSAPKADDRRAERMDTQRPQARLTEPRPAVAAPAVRAEPRAAVATPAVRAESRPFIAAPAVRTESRPFVAAPAVRAEPRQAASTPAPRPDISAPNAARRMENNPPRGAGAGQRGNGIHRERSATARTTASPDAVR